MTDRELQEKEIAIETWQFRVQLLSLLLMGTALYLKYWKKRS
jgi:hypothetical protein